MFSTYFLNYFKIIPYTLVIKVRGHVDITVLSIFQKAVTFDYNLTRYIYLFSLFLEYFFVGIYILNEKV